MSIGFENTELAITLLPFINHWQDGLTRYSPTLAGAAFEQQTQ